MDLKDKFTEKVSETTKEVVKDTFNELTTPDTKNKEVKTVKPPTQDKDFRMAATKMLDDTKDFLQKNQGNWVLLTQKMYEYSLKNIKVAKENAKKYYEDNKKRELEQFERKHSKIVIIDATSGDKKEYLKHVERLSDLI